MTAGNWFVLLQLQGLFFRRHIKKILIRLAMEFLQEEHFSYWKRYSMYFVAVSIQNFLHEVYPITPSHAVNDNLMNLLDQFWVWK